MQPGRKSRYETLAEESDLSRFRPPRGSRICGLEKMYARRGGAFVAIPSAGPQ